MGRSDTACDSGEGSKARSFLRSLGAIRAWRLADDEPVGVLYLALFETRGWDNDNRPGSQNLADFAAIGLRSAGRQLRENFRTARPSVEERKSEYIVLGDSERSLSIVASKARCEF